MTREPVPEGGVLRTIALKEFMDFTRRPWILALAGFFFLLVLAGAYTTTLGAAPPQGEFVATLAAVQSAVRLTIPLMALILAHASVAGERESGSFSLLLSQPVTRREVVLGKFFGLVGVLAGALVLGFALGAAVVAIRTGSADLGTFARFLSAGIFYAGAYLGLFMLVSAASATRTAALVNCLLIIVAFGFLYDILLFYIGTKVTPADNPVPLWVVALSRLSIPNLYAGTLDTVLNPDRYTSATAGFEAIVAGRWSPIAYPSALVAWIAGTITGARLVLERKDV